MSVRVASMPQAERNGYPNRQRSWSGTVEGRPPEGLRSKPGRWPHLSWLFYASTGGHPDLQRGGERRADVAASRRVPARSGRARGRRRQSRWHRRAGRGGERSLSRRASAAAEREVRTGECVPGRLRLGARAGVRRLHRDGLRLLARPGGLAGVGRADRRGVRGRHRVPLCRRRFDPELGVAS